MGALNQPMWMAVAASSALSFPSDGEGGISVLRTGGTATGATTFTATTVTDAGPWALTNVVAGDYVAVSTGEWGVVQSKSGATVTVDKWHYHVVGQRTATTRTPATGASNVNIYGPNILAGAIDYRIGSITFPLQTATQTCAVTDQVGVARASLTYTMTAGNPQSYFGESQDSGGIPFNVPFGIKCSSTGIIVVVQFAIIR